MNYADMAATATRLITANGKPVTLRNYAAATYDHVTMTYVPGAATDVSANAVEQEYSLKEIEGTLIQQGDRKFLLASPTAPTLTMKIVVSGEEMSIVHISPVQPGTVTLCYTVWARK